MDPYIKAVTSLLTKPHQEGVQRAYKRFGGRRVNVQQFVEKWEAATAHDQALTAFKNTLAQRMGQVNGIVAGMAHKKTPFKAAAASLKGKIQNRRTRKQMGGFQIDDPLDDSYFE